MKRNKKEAGKAERATRPQPHLTLSEGGKQGSFGAGVQGHFAKSPGSL